MGDIWRMNSHMEAVVRAYKTLTKIPSIVGGRLNCKGNRITSRWSIRNLDKGKNTQYLIDYILDENLGVLAQSQFGVDISHELLTAISPKENFKAVIREEKEDKDGAKKKFFLEVWSSTSLKHSIDLTALDIHGDVYTDSEFGSLDWSPDESKVVYVAEKKIKKSEPFIKRKPAEDKNVDPDKRPVPGQEHIHRDDWGEQLTGKIETVVVVCKLADETFTVYDMVPGCPGQVRFSPSGDSIIGITWEAKMLGRLGLIYCTNRPSFVFCLTLSGTFITLSSGNKAVRSPRIAPNGDLFWLQREAHGPHHACHQLVRLASEDLKNLLGSEDGVDHKVSVVIDIVKTEQEISNGVFYGIYCQSLPAKCFSADSKRLVFSTQQQTEIRSYVVDIESGRIVDISNNKKSSGSTTVLSVQADVILATFSSMTTPGQLFVARLPSVDNESTIEWVRVSSPSEVPSSVANAKLQYMALKQDTQDSVSSFTAIYFGPDEGKVYPLVVWPHGGPHSAFSNSYSLEAAFFNMIGFACLMINYRGSSGTGDSSIFYLPSRVGTADVDDCRLATQKALDQFPIDDKRLLLYGGSHGGFLVCHLSGVYPEMYSVTVARNPVIDLASMSNTSDIADWCAVEAGWPYTEEGPLDEDQLLTLRRVSPITHVQNVLIPTALMLGSKDKRVPHYQGLEYARRLKANGVKVAVYMYEDNHALSSLPVEMDNLLNAADWLITHIKP
ncbi:acylamino-acid-releasing enzyme-like isoform X1 [Maniola jurtina]|uniref:acylamino-acid-releasing enzyme-like isoform X1 n=1 Tax=Maniola jurtina TaxID=191418 RepID=UPI001E689AD5|nr:acylamino-acid-releasing enzyme-like isoform X1 [Maniola jurtina]XP_045771471.1 acylamino-acid-releasing enzyme-like isoform X1 [Maniola jurtina]XP_045771472.1 acylamino-acid-releasing enzyme-like isoform X1 [Maniola jurtina]